MNGLLSRSRRRTLRYLAGTGAVALLLAACTNELAEQIEEDVLVKEAGGRPKVVGRVPEPDAVGVVTYAPIQITFDMDLDETTITSDAISIYPVGSPDSTVEGTLEYNTDTRTVTFTPTARMDREAAFRVEVSDFVKNVGGATLASSVSWGFETIDVNPDEVRIDLTSTLTPQVSAAAPLYVWVTLFPVDIGNIEVFGPFTATTETIILNQETDLFGSDVEDYSIVFFHDQNGDVDVDAGTGGSDPFWFYLNGAVGNANPDEFNGISEFNGLDPAVEANQDMKVDVGSRIAVDLLASPADDFPGYASSTGADFLDGSFIDLGEAPFTTPYVATADSRYDVDWFMFTVPAGGGGDYTITTTGVSDTVEIYHELYLYEYDAGGSPPGPNERGKERSTFNESSKIGYVTYDTAGVDNGGPLTAGETYYFAVLNFWSDSFGTPRDVNQSAEYEITITNS